LYKAKLLVTTKYFREVAVIGTRGAGLKTFSSVKRNVTISLFSPLKEAILPLQRESTYQRFATFHELIAELISLLTGYLAFNY
jgi:hypothetical protein